MPRISWHAVPFQDRPWLEDSNRYVVSFTTELPFGLALDDAWSVALAQPNELEAVTDDELTVTFYPAVEEAKLPGYFSLLPDFRVVLAQFGERARPVARTICEVVASPSERFEASDLAVSRSFDQGLDAINRILAEYAVDTMDWTVREVAKEDLPALALVTIKDLEEPWYAHSFVRLHDLDGLVKEPLAEESLARIAEQASVARADDQLRAFHRHRVRADRSPDQGRYAETIIEASMAIEAYVVWLLDKRAEESGEPAAGERELEASGLRRVLTRRMHDWLGGQWDISRQGTPLATWYTDIHLPRNRCVHGGYRPNHRQATAAVSAGRCLTDYFKERLQATGRGSWVDEGRVAPPSQQFMRYHWEHGRLERFPERPEDDTATGSPGQ